MPEARFTDIPPARMIREVANLPPLSRDAFATQNFAGLRLNVEGIVISCYDAVSYALVLVENGADGARAAARFSQPVAPELLTLREGDRIAFVGEILDVSETSVALRDCVLAPGKTKEVTPEKAVARPVTPKQEWHQRWWGNLSIQAVAGIIAGLVAGVIVLYLGWRYFH